MRRFALLICLVASACAHGVIAKASPDPLRKVCDYQLMPAQFDRVRVGHEPEAQWLQGLAPSDREHYLEERAMLESEFHHTFTRALGGESSVGYHVIPSFVRIEPAYCAGWQRCSKTKVYLEMTITDPNGTWLETVSIKRSVAGSIRQPTTASQLKQSADDLANRAVSFLRENSGC